MVVVLCFGQQMSIVHFLRCIGIGMGGVGV